MTTTDIGALIAATAEQWIGTPFHWQAQVQGVGCDCKGLVAGVARDCGRAEADELEALEDLGIAERVALDERLDGG